MHPGHEDTKKTRAGLESAGFTLIELMITMVIVILALVGYIGANTAVNHRSEEAFEKTVALQDAHAVVEMIRNVTLNGQFPDGVTQAFPNNGAVAGFNNLRNEQILVMYANTAADPLDVTVRVSWLSRGQRQVSTDLRTFVTRRAA